MVWHCVSALVLIYPSNVKPQDKNSSKFWTMDPCLNQVHFCHGCLARLLAMKKTHNISSLSMCLGKAKQPQCASESNFHDSEKFQFYFSHIFLYFVYAVEHQQLKFTERLSHIVVISVHTHTQRNQKLLYMLLKVAVASFCVLAHYLQQWTLQIPLFNQITVIF